MDAVTLCARTYVIYYFVIKGFDGTCPNTSYPEDVQNFTDTVRRYTHVILYKGKKALT